MSGSSTASYTAPATPTRSDFSLYLLHERAKFILIARYDF